MLDESGNRKTLIFMLDLICNIEANFLDIPVMVVGVFLGCAWPHPLDVLWFAHGSLGSPS